jgi:serine/threonine protein kinase
LQKSIEIDWALRIKLALQVARALNYLHTRTPKIIHRDLKAENVFIDDDWNAHLGDFGTTRNNVFTRNYCLLSCDKHSNVHLNNIYSV